MKHYSYSIYYNNFNFIIYLVILHLNWIKLNQNMKISKIWLEIQIQQQIQNLRMLEKVNNNDYQILNSYI